MASQTSIPTDSTDEEKVVVDGPRYERDRHGVATGCTYYACTYCGIEAARRQDVRQNHRAACPAARRDDHSEAGWSA